MKRIKYILLLTMTIASFLGCKKESYVAAFEDLPHERIKAQMDTLNNLLVNTPNGWVGTMSTGLGGGFGFYMTFDNNEYVNMYADLTDGAASTVKRSRYRVRQDAGAALTFDTYTYISILNNPEASAFGGTQREGFRSDIDFIYDRSNGDTLVMIGKRYRQVFTLVKATADQKARYEAGSYLTAINAFKQYFVSNPNSYFEIGTQKISVEANSATSMASGKRLTLTTITDNKVVTATQKFAYTIDNMQIVAGGLKFNDILFTKLAWKNSTTLAIYDNTGKEYILNNNPTPLLPLHMLWGSKYTGMLSDFKQINPGTSTDGAAILNYYHNNLSNPNPPRLLDYSFNCGNIRLTWDVVNKRLNFLGWHTQSGCSGNPTAPSGGWTTTAVYNYTKTDDGVYTFTLRAAASGGYVTNITTQMNNFLLNNTVRFDYYVDAGVVYGNMISVTNPNINMTFRVY